jgi:hypothetical protein
LAVPPAAQSTAQLPETTGRPGLLDRLTQTFVVQARHSDMQIETAHSDLDLLEIKPSPPAGKASAFKIDVGLVHRLLQSGPILGSIILATSDPQFPEITVPVRGEII